MCLKLCIQLLNHKLRHTEYESFIIRRMAVMGLSENRGWKNAEDYTSIHSGFIKIARMLVVR
jgi:hypothetical protein